MCSEKGFTLIELMIGIVIVSVLLAAGMPSFNGWIINTQTRSAAESIQNGLQMARVEAVRRNTNVRFSLTDAAGNIVWNVGCVTVTANCPATIASKAGTAGGGKARVGVSASAFPSPIPATHFATAISSGTGLPAGVSFNGIGGVVAANIGTDVTRIDVTNSASATARRLVVTIGTGGSIRMCDPLLALSSNPQGCS